MSFRLAAGIAALVTVLSPLSPAHAQATIDKPIATFATFATFSNMTATAESDKTIRLADYTGAKKAVVLIFVANRCGITWLYANKMAALIRDYGKRPDTAIVLVHSNFEESDKEITDTLKQYKLSLPLLDDKPKQELANYFDVHVTPVFVVIDRNGILRYKGAFDKMGGSIAESKRPQYLRPALNAVLAGKPVAIKTTRALGCEIAPRNAIPLP